MPLLASLPPGAIDSIVGQVAVQALRGALYAIASLQHMPVDRVPEIIQLTAGQTAAHNSEDETGDDEPEEEGDETLLEMQAATQRAMVQLAGQVAPDGQVVAQLLDQNALLLIAGLSTHSGDGENAHKKQKSG